LRARLASAAAVLVALPVGFYAGAGATLAALLIGASALALGGLLDRRRDRSTWHLVSLGLGVIAGLVGWLLPFPVHSRWIYLVFFAVLVAARPSALAVALRTGAARWRAAAQEHPAWTTLLLLAGAVASLSLWLPTMGYDDNAFHLSMGQQLRDGHYYRMDAWSQAWALAPWSNDALHAVASLVAGADARAAIAAVWLLAGIGGAWRLATALGASRATAIAAAAVFASHPLTVYFGSTLQVDGAVAAILLHLSAEFAEHEGRLDSPVATGVLLGLLAGLKASNGVFALPFLGWFGWQALSTRQWRPALAIAAIAAVVGGSSYAYAWIVSGNPLLPLYNGIFKSPFVPLENFHDPRWHAGIGWLTPWDLSAHTDRYGEVYRGAAGIAFLGSLPGVLMQAWRGGVGRWLALGTFASALLLFSQLQYFRYVFPCVAVLTTIGIVAYGRAFQPRLLAVLVVLLVLGNLALFKSGSWLLHNGPWGVLVREGRAALMAKKIPERVLLERLASAQPAACVLMTDPEAPFVAGAPIAFTTSRYDHQLEAERALADQDPSGGRWQALLRRTGVTHVEVGGQPNAALAAALAAMQFQRVDAQGAAVLWARPGPAPCDRRFLDGRDEAKRLFGFGGQP
jgi:hypothetical protein